MKVNYLLEVNLLSTRALDPEVRSEEMLGRLRSDLLFGDWALCPVARPVLGRLFHDNVHEAPCPSSGLVSKACPRQVALGSPHCLVPETS